MAHAAPLLRLAANGEAVAANIAAPRAEDGRCRDVAALHSGARLACYAARLEGGCHAGRKDGELVAAVAPAAHAARLV